MCPNVFRTVALNKYVLNELISIYASIKILDNDF